MSSAKRTVTAIGVDFGGTSIKLGVARGAELLETGEPLVTAAYPDPNALIGAIAQRVKSMKERFADVCGVGVQVIANTPRTPDTAAGIGRRAEPGPSADGRPERGGAAAAHAR